MGRDVPADLSPTGEPSGPGASPELRASDADRDRVVDVLRVAAGDGRLAADELDERQEAALSSRTLSELAVLTADLVAGPGIVANADSLTVRSTKVDIAPGGEPGEPVVLRVQLAGCMRYGRIDERWLRAPRP